MYKTKDINIVDLQVSKINPRFIQVVIDEQAAINEIIKLEPSKMMSLVKSISKRVLPLPFYLVVQDGEHIVMDGNRRLTAMKILKNPSLIPDVEKYKDLKTFCIENKSCDLPKTMPCIVYDSYNDDLLSVLENLHVSDESKSDWTPLAQYRMSQRMGGSKHKWMKSLLYYFEDAEVDKMTLGHSDKFNRAFLALSIANIHIYDDGHIEGDEIKEKLKILFSLFKNKELDTRSPKESYNEWVNKIFKDNCKPEIKINEYNIIISNSQFYAGQKIDLETLKVDIRDKVGKKINFANDDVEVKLLDAAGNEIESLNPDFIGIQEVLITYKDVSKKFKINIINRLDPEIIFVSDKFTLERGNTCDLYKLISRATNGFGQDVKSKIKIKSIDGIGKVFENVFTDENGFGEYGFAYKFTDVTGSPYSKVVYIEVVEKIKTPITSLEIDEKLISFDKKIVLNLGTEIGEIVREINNLNMTEYPAVISCSCRSIVELLFDQLYKADKVEFKSGFKDKLVEIKNKLLRGGLSTLIKSDGVLPAFKKEENFLIGLNVDEINADLNQCAHNSIAMVNKNKIEEIIRKELTHLLVICNEWINN